MLAEPLLRQRGRLSDCKTETNGLWSYLLYSQQYPTGTADVWWSHYLLKLPGICTKRLDFASFDGARNREVDSLRCLNNRYRAWVCGYGQINWICRNRRQYGRSEKWEWYALYQNGELTSYKRLTQLIRSCWSAGGQDRPNLTLFVIFVERGSPTFSPKCFE